MTLRRALGIVSLAGALSLSYELVWFRAVSVLTAGYAGAFGALLGVFLFGLAFGAWIARRACRDDADTTVAQAALGRVLLAANVAGFLVVPTLAFGARHIATACLAVVPLALSAAGSGAVLPLVSHAAVAADERAGQRLSYLYVANIAGSVVGTLVTGFVLMDAWPLARLALAMAFTGLALTAAVCISAGERRTLMATGVLAVALLLGGAKVFDRLWERLVLRWNLRDDSHFAFVLENRHGVINVTDDRRIYGGGAYDGVISTDLVRDPNLIARAFALAAYHPHPRRVLAIGMSGGAWARVLATMPGLEELTVVEINPGYLTLVARYPEVAPLLTDPRVHIEIDDGRRWLQRHPDARFDAVVQNTTYHWRAHITNLLSTEYLALIRAHLDPGGVAMYNTTWSAEAQRTGALVFPYANRLYNFMVVSDAPLAFDGDRFRTMLTAWRIDGRPVLDPSVPGQRRRIEQLVALGRTPPSATASLETRAQILARTASRHAITDDNLESEYPSWWP